LWVTNGHHKPSCSWRAALSFDAEFSLASNEYTKSLKIEVPRW
jgi:hypothetical protein